MARKGPQPLADVVGELIAPACRKRGIASVQLTLEPADLFGARFAPSARVEKIIWPARDKRDGGEGATLLVRADGATALALQHIAPQIVERANLIIGWPAIQRLRITQAGAPPAPRPKSARRPKPLDPGAIAAVEAELDGITHQDLKAALSRLGARVSQRALSKGPERP
ncbi:MAG: DciA family protein [Pseudomonadota bacterium]